jgi:hypothetical protein
MILPGRRSSARRNCGAAFAGLSLARPHFANGRMTGHRRNRRGNRLLVVTTWHVRHRHAVHGHARAVDSNRRGRRAWGLSCLGMALGCVRCQAARQLARRGNRRNTQKQCHDGACKYSPGCHARFMLRQASPGCNAVGSNGSRGRSRSESLGTPRELESVEAGRIFDQDHFAYFRIGRPRGEQV